MKKIDRLVFDGYLNNIIAKCNELVDVVNFLIDEFDARTGRTPVRNGEDHERD